MTRYGQLLVRVYQRALRLYPRGLREAFEEEMLAVFILQAADAETEGAIGLLKTGLKELRTLPAALLASHLRERRIRQMQNRLQRWFGPSPGSWQETLLALAPFLLLVVAPGLLLLIQGDDAIPQSAGIILIVGGMLFLALLGVIGLLASLPRWSMPYAGIGMGTITYGGLLTLDAYSIFFNSGAANWFWRMAGFLLVYFIGLILVVGICVWLSKRVAFTRPFYENLQKEPGLLSFAMYGMSLVMVVGMYEETIGADWLVLLSGLAMSISAYLYLRQQNWSQQLVSMLVGFTVAMLIGLVASTQMVDFISPAAFHIEGLAVSRTVVSAVLIWLVCIGTIIVPGTRIVSRVLNPTS